MSTDKVAAADTPAQDDKAVDTSNPKANATQDIVYSQRCILYRYGIDLSDNKVWKQRGIGNMKIIKEKATGLYKLKMHQESSLRLVLWAGVIGKLTANDNSDRAWTWHTTDYSSGEGESSSLAVKFKTTEIADEFKKLYEQYGEENTKLLASADDKKDDAADAKKDDAADAKKDDAADDKKDDAAPAAADAAPAAADAAPAAADAAPAAAAAAPAAAAAAPAADA
jgi:hypothetical protein